MSECDELLLLVDDTTDDREEKRLLLSVFFVRLESRRGGCPLVFLQH